MKTWEYCNCHPFHTVKCGCNEDHQLLIVRHQPVHWRGKHWAVQCCLEAALQELSELTKEKPQLDCRLPDTI